jgi:hypothetical protein
MNKKDFEKLNTYCGEDMKKILSKMTGEQIFIGKAKNTGDVYLEDLIEYEQSEKKRKFYQSMKGKDIYEVCYWRIDLDRDGEEDLDYDGSYWFENKKLRDEFYSEEVARGWTDG